MATTLNLIAVPNGVDAAGDLAVSIVVAPRLTDHRRLQRFPDVLAWPSSLAAGRLRIRLRFANGIVDARPDLAALRPALWDELFDDDTPVEPFVFDDASNDLVVSYRTRDALALVKDAYQQTIASSPGDEPSTAASARRLAHLALPQGDELAPMLGEWRQRRWHLQSARGDDHDLSPAAAETTRDFALFYRMPQPGPRAPDPVPRSEDELASLLDFHAAVTALSSHPTLLRALGLVIDVTVLAGDVAAAGVLGMPLGAVSVEDFRTASGFRDATLMTPQVLYRHHPKAAGLKPVFATAEPAASAEIVEGFLGLDERQFHLVDLDIDGAFAKLTSLAGGLPRALQSPTAHGALPALRSAGLSLVVHDRGREVVAALKRAAGINAAITQGGAAAPLTARDLVRGYRVDVWSSGIRKWRSLHKRRATYTVGETGAVQFNTEEEGFAQFATASPAADPTRAAQPGPPVETDRYVHEALARWTGWSLSAPRPGTPIHRSDEHNPLKDDDTATALVTAFHVRQAFVPVPGSLPVLRFGQRYRMRVRVVDIAGNSPAANEREAVAISAPTYPIALPPDPETQPYFRYEPVPHPLLVLRSIPARGRPALDRLVIRSFNSDPSLDDDAATETDERHVAPPRASVDLAERHGMLDDASGRPKGDAATFAEVVERNDAAFPTAPVGTPPRDVPIDSAARLIVRYLPDPFARGAAFRFLPGVAPGRVAFAGTGALSDRMRDPHGEAGPIVQVHFGTGWPGRDAMRLVIADGSAPPEWDRDERVLTAFVPKSTVAVVRLSSILGDGDLDVMGVWAWQREYLDRRAQSIVSNAGTGIAAALENHARLTAVLLRLALEGCQWALTPSIPVQLIHAVQQPLGRPRFLSVDTTRVLVPLRGGTMRAGRRTGPASALIAVRALGSPDAALIGALDAHLRSTGRVDLIASWSDIADDVTDPRGFVRTEATESLAPIKVDRFSGPIPAEGASGRIVADAVDGKELRFLPERYEGSTLRAPSAPIHQFGDTRHRKVTYTAVSTSRFEEDFPAGAGLTFTRASEPVEVSVPNSAKPSAPRIAYVLPTFGWRRERSGTLTSSIRQGRGLRVYIERPWFVSGEGELLGVVTWPAQQTAPGKDDRRDRYAGLVTEWGLDPLRPSGSLALMPSVSHFTDAVVAMSTVQVPEAGISADIAGHAVQTDGERWYADITLAAEEAYMPFVRLALVRFQPDSIPGAEISAVASAGFMQIAPDRSAVLIADPALPRVYRLVVSGVGPTPSTQIPWRNTIEVSVEERRGETETDLDWQPVAGGTAKVTPLAASPSGPAVLFSGLVDFAAQPAPGRYRLVIREYETWQVDRPESRKVRFGRLEDPNVELASPAESIGRRAETPPSPVTSGASRDFLHTARALERLEIAVAGPATGRRLVYAEFIGVEPAAALQDLSLAKPGADGQVSDTPGDDLVQGDAEDPPRPWQPQPATPLLGFEPHWEEMPDVGPSMSPAVVSGALKLAQSMLNTALELQPPLAIDGLFGLITEGAIRAIRRALLLPDDGGLDLQGWVALATAAPFPVLEPGRGSPPMAGPPVALVQRLLNMVSTGALIAEDGVFGPATAGRVKSFQAANNLPQTGVVDRPTWLELGDVLDLVHPAGTERIVLEFDRARAAGGGPALVLIEREQLEDAAVPVSDPIDESWSGRSGLWLELQDSRAQTVYKQRLGHELTRSPEVPPDATSGERIARPGSAIEETRLSIVLPIIPAARRMVVFGRIDEGDQGPATALAIFEPWM